MPSIILPVRTPRLTLRDFTPGDFDAIHAYASDLDVTRFMFHGPRTPADTQDYLDRMLASQREEPRLTWELAVVVTQVNRLVGACDLTCENEHEGDLGFIFARNVWGAGYATEAARAMVRAGFEELGLTRIFSTCDIGNGASAHVLEKAGLTRVTTLHRHRYALGKWWTSYLYELRRDSPAPRRPGH
jgi:[ribosomal protein S5]-alanine N-acetyltransferase